MGAPSLWLLEDGGRERWSPFSEAGPVGELRFGCLRLRERIAAAVGSPVEGYIGPSWLVGFQEPAAPPVRSSEQNTGGATLLLSSRFVPDGPGPSTLGEAATGPTTGAVPIITGNGSDSETTGIGWSLPSGVAIPHRDGAPRLPTPLECRDGLERESTVRLSGRLLDGPWELMHRNADRIRRDVAASAPDRGVGDGSEEVRARGTTILGDHAVILGERVQLDPHVVLDAREGPIHLSSDVSVSAFTVLEGPVWVGPHAKLLGGRIAHSTIGPVCKVRGEVEASVIMGFGNKAHSGYLGHAMTGRWVNLGAGTTNSDLKNTYSSVRLGPGNDWEVDTGLLKVGAFLGDHVKTGIGTLLNTGTIVGAGTNLFGGVMPPRWIPPFSWGSGDRLVPFELDRFLEVARIAMDRRGRELPESMAELYTRLWVRTHGTRVP